MAENSYQHHLPIGLNLGEYRIEGVLGQGGFGVTYLATDLNLGRKFAIKEYMPGEIAVRSGNTAVVPKSEGDGDDFQFGLDSFQKEARTLAAFSHPNLNQVVRYFNANRTAYMVLEYVEGETLSAYLQRNATLNEAELKNLLECLLGGLSVVHNADYTHRDIKPANIMIKPDGNPVLLDFGAARQALGYKSKSITAILTPGYAPVEQYDTKAEDIGPWTDFYSLGMVAYQCVSGCKSKDLIEAVTRLGLHRKKKLDQDLTPAEVVGQGRYDANLLQGIDWALQLYEENRPQSVEAWCEKLFTKDSEDSVTVAPPTPPVIDKPPRKPVEDKSPRKPVVDEPPENPEPTGRADGKEEKTEKSNAGKVLWFAAAGFLLFICIISLNKCETSIEQEAQYEASSVKLATVVGAGNGKSERIKSFPEKTTPFNSWVVAWDTEVSPSVLVARVGSHQTSDDAILQVESSLQGFNLVYRPRETYTAIYQVDVDGVTLPAFDACYAGRCERNDDEYAIPLDAQSLQRLKAGSTLTVATVDTTSVSEANTGVPEGAQRFVFALKGSTAAISAVSGYNPNSNALSFDNELLQQAVILYLGLSGEIDKSKSRQLFLQAAENQDPFAVMWLARLYHKGRGGFEENVDKAEQLARPVIAKIKTLAAEGSAQAAQLLGSAYNDGLSVSQDDTQAARWFLKAANAGLPMAMDYLGSAYKSGSGVSRNYTKTLNWYRKAAYAGYSTAMTSLGAVYRKGEGVPQDNATAYSWYLSAASAGEDSAMDNLADVYRAGLGVAKDYNQAVSWYREAAELGNSDAMFWLGYIYKNCPDDGVGYYCNSSTAESWYGKAVDAGDITAMNNLGLILEKRGDYTAALSLFQRSADGGSPHGMMNLGDLYADGSGITQNKELAFSLYEKACMDGNSAACGKHPNGVNISNEGWAISISAGGMWHFTDDKLIVELSNVELKNPSAYGNKEANIYGLELQLSKYIDDDGGWNTVLDGKMINTTKFKRLKKVNTERGKAIFLKDDESVMLDKLSFSFDKRQLLALDPPLSDYWLTMTASCGGLVHAHSKTRFESENVQGWGKQLFK